jgi:hypothetical protein
MKNAMLVSILCAVALLAGCATSSNERPVWVTDAAKAAAAPLCVDNRGVDHLRPTGDGDYWLTCSDGRMMRVSVDQDQVNAR